MSCEICRGIALCRLETLALTEKHGSLLEREKGVKKDENLVESQ